MHEQPSQKRTRSPEKEKPPRIVERFIVVDMDRTLLASDEFVRYLYDVYALDGEQRQIVQQHVKDSKGSGFDAFGYLQQHYPDRLQGFEGESGEVEVEVIADWVIERHGLPKLQEDLLISGTTELFRAIDARQVPHGVLTAGSDTYQRLKAAVLRRLLVRPALPVMVVAAGDVPDKTAMLVDACWKDDRQLFLLPVQLSGETIAAKNLVVIDDKDQNLKTPHGNIHTVHIGTHDLYTAANMIDK